MKLGGVKYYPVPRGRAGGYDSEWWFYLADGGRKLPTICREIIPLDLADEGQALLEAEVQDTCVKTLFGWRR